MAVALIIILLVIVAIAVGGGPIIRNILAALVGVAGLIWFASTTTTSELLTILGVTAVITGGVVLAILAFSGNLKVRGRTDGKGKRRSDAVKYSVADRERMLGEAEEIEPSIYQHPTGLFIVRGPKGGTKIHPTIDNARAHLNR
jgi:hypothetical protein